MSAFISLVLLGICVVMLVTHFAEIKNSHRKNG